MCLKAGTFIHSNYSPKVEAALEALTSLPTKIIPAGWEDSQGFRESPEAQKWRYSWRTSWRQDTVSVYSCDRNHRLAQGMSCGPPKYLSSCPSQTWFLSSLSFLWTAPNSLAWPCFNILKLTNKNHNQYMTPKWFFCGSIHYFFLNYISVTKFRVIKLKIVTFFPCIVSMSPQCISLHLFHSLTWNLHTRKVSETT